jgi:signal peptidase II
MPSGGDRRLFWIVLASVIGLDVVTKLAAVATLSRFPLPVLGDWVTLQLVYNPGAAFGIHVGGASRWVFTGLALIALVVLGLMVRQTRPEQRLRLMALGLVCGGAIGNLIDRIRNARGVVDFIDVGVGAYRWPTFNVADIAVTSGAVVLAFILWGEGREPERQRSEADHGGTTDPANASSTS